MSSDFFGSLVTMWNNPAVDLSGIFISEKYINMTKDQIAEINDINRSSMQALTNNNLISDSGINISNDNTILVTPNVTNLLFDSSDNADYHARYVSFDSLDVNNDASDIAFFRIVNAEDPRIVVFPNPEYSGYIAPGISNTKFRQFILLQLSEASQERMQIVETSDDFQLLFYGKRPEILQISGILKNTSTNPWSMNMLFLWDNMMRGTKLAEQGNILQLYAGRNLYSGYPFGFQRSKIAPNDFIVNFSFSFIVKERIGSDDIKIQYT